MADKWMIHGLEFTNCVCSYGCPCQFNAPSTHGYCQAVLCGHIDEGYFNDTRLDGLDWASIYAWPGEIAQGNGKQQVIIDSKADAKQRESLRKILHGESTTPGATHFFVFNAMSSEVMETLYAPFELQLDMEGRRAKAKVPGLLEVQGSPIKSPFDGSDYRARINLPNGFEYTMAEIGAGTSKSLGGVKIEMNDTYGQFCMLHMNQNGVIR